MTHISQRTRPAPGRLHGPLGHTWEWTLAFGVLTLVAGIAVVVWPGPTLVLIALIIGAQLAVTGVFQFARAFITRGHDGGSRVLLGVFAVLSFLAGMILLRHPFRGVAVLALALGLYWVVGGVIEAFYGLSEKGLPGRPMVIVTGVLSVLAGIVVLLFPLGGLVALTWVFGIWLIVYGITGVSAAFAIRKGARRHAVNAAAPRQEQSSP